MISRLDAISENSFFFISCCALVLAHLGNMLSKRYAAVRIGLCLRLKSCRFSIYTISDCGMVHVKTKSNSGHSA